MNCGMWATYTLASFVFESIGLFFQAIAAMLDAIAAAFGAWFELAFDLSNAVVAVGTVHSVSMPFEIIGKLTQRVRAVPAHSQNCVALRAKPTTKLAG